MKSKWESFKIDNELLDVIRKYAKKDNRSIKAVIEIVLRKNFMEPKEK